MINVEIINDPKVLLEMKDNLNFFINKKSVVSGFCFENIIQRHLRVYLLNDEDKSRGDGQRFWFCMVQQPKGVHLQSCSC